MKKILLIALVLLAGCAQSDEIKIGVIIVPLTGAIPYIGEDIQQATNLAIEEVNDAAMILVNALKNCPDFDEDCMISYVSSLENYPGAGGPLTFDKETWSFDKPFVMKTIIDGEFTVVQT